MSVISSTTATWRLAGKVGEDSRVRQILIDESPFRVGRNSNQHLSIPVPTVSSNHAEIRLANEKLELRDLGSTNGTFVNGERLRQSCLLKEGDLVQFAQEVFRVEHADDSNLSRTMFEDSAGHALSLIQFDKLISERAVVPHFQKIVKVESQETLGYEVLGRSRLYGLRTPKAMFNAAAVLHLEADLSRLLREEGIAHGASLPDADPLFLNTHPKELLDVDILLFSLEQLRDIEPTRPIVLEIHEKAITSTSVMRHLHAKLADLAIDLAYDDFGAGQARFLELADVPPEYLKFDIELIRGIDSASKERRRLVEQLVGMANELGVATLAEGVETQGEHNACHELGFLLGQGYFYGKPAPLETNKSE